MRHKLIRLSGAFLRYLGRTVTRIVITTLVVSTCLAFILRLLGLPVPSPYQLLHDFEGLSKLAKILS